MLKNKNLPNSLRNSSKSSLLVSLNFPLKSKEVMLVLEYNNNENNNELK